MVMSGLFLGKIEGNRGKGKEAILEKISEAEINMSARGVLDGTDLSSRAILSNGGGF